MFRRSHYNIDDKTRYKSARRISRAVTGRPAIKRTLIITLLAILGGVVLAVSLVLVLYLLLSFYAAGRQ